MILFLLASCGPDKKFKGYSDLFGDVMQSDEGFFRGNSPGMRLPDVKKNETDSLGEEDKNFLFYLSKKNEKINYSVEYNFNDEGLYQIRFDAFMNDEAGLKMMLDDFGKYYSQKFGKGEPVNGAICWKTKQGKKDITILLQDETEDYHHYKFSLDIYNEFAESLQ